MGVKAADIVCYPSEFNQTISSDYTQKFDVYLQSRNRVSMKTLIFSTDHRVVPVEKSVVGEKATVHFEVMCLGMQGGSVIRGALQFVAEGTEFEIPYEFTVAGRSEDGMVPTVATLKEFAALAEKDYEKALKMFCSSYFVTFPFMKDLKLRAFYETLIHGANSGRAMEEFLVAKAGKHQMVLTAEAAAHVYLEPLEGGNEGEQVLTCDEIDDMAMVSGDTLAMKSRKKSKSGKYADLHYTLGADGKEEESLTGAIVLKMEYPGFCELTLEATAPFIRLKTERLSTSDFRNEESTAVVTFEILPEHLYQGENFGSIRVILPDRVYEAKVTAELLRKVSEGRQKRLMNSHLYAELYDCFIAYQICTPAEQSKYVDRMKEIVSYRRKEAPEEIRPALAMAYLYHASGEMEEFRSVMEAVYDEVSEHRKEDVEAYCFYLYLRYLMKPGTEQKDTVARLLKKYYVDRMDSLYLLLMLIRVDDQRLENDELAYEMLREQFHKGCRSPLLYLSACQMINRHTEKVKKLEGFELQSVLFGARHRILTPDAVDAITALIMYEKDFRAPVYRLACYLYEAVPKKTTLAAILCVLIGGRKIGEQFFPYYEKGIIEDVRLTGLYENYLSSVPMGLSKPMPTELLLFCADKEDLNLTSREHLYHNVVTYFPKESQIYREYKDHMETYAIEQLFAGRYNTNLLELYNEFLFAEMIDERVAPVLPVMLSMKRLTCEAGAANWVILRYPEIAGEYRYAMKNGEVCLPVYDTEDAIIVFEDNRGVRYANFRYQLKSLMDHEDFMDLCRKYGTNDMILKVLDSRALLDKKNRKPEQIYSLMVLLDMAEVAHGYKEKIVTSLISYCEETGHKDAMDSFLLKLDSDNLDPKDRHRLVELLSERGFIKETYQILHKYGLEGYSVDVRQNVARFEVLRTSYDYDPFLLGICLDLYRQKRTNHVLLSYLIRYFNGITEEMLELLDAGEAYEHIEWADFPERLLAQMMFTGHMDRLGEVFRLYLKVWQEQQKPLFTPIVNAYFVLKCHNHFLGLEPEDEEVYQYLEQKLMDDPKYDFADICKIDLLFQYSKKGLLEKKRSTLAKNLMEELYAKGYLFAFYTKLRKHFDLPRTLNGRVILEHRSTEADRVIMEYEIVPRSTLVENEGAGEAVLTAKKPKKPAAKPAAGTEDASGLKTEEGTEQDTRKKGRTTCVMDPVYPGIFAVAMTLFHDEALSYQVVEEKDHTILSTGENKIFDSRHHRSIRKGSRFDKLNNIAGVSNIDVELEALLTELTETDILIEKLYPLA